MDFQKVLSEAACEIKRSAKSGEKIAIVSHYDADGISSASIISSALGHIGADFDIFIERRLTRRIVGNVLASGSDLHILTDIGSSYGCSKELGRAVIADHHRPAFSDFGIHVNPLFHGNDNCSGSCISYLLARELGCGKEISGLAVIGALGDCVISPPSPITKNVLKDAQDSSSAMKSRGLKFFGRSTRPIHTAIAGSFDPVIPGMRGDESRVVQLLSDIGVELADRRGMPRTLCDLSPGEQRLLSDALVMETVKSGGNPESLFGDVFDLPGKNIRDGKEFATALNAFGRTGNGKLGVDFCLGRFKDYSSISLEYRRMVSRAISVFKRKKEDGKKISYCIAGSSIEEDVIGTVTSILSRENGLPLMGMADTEDGEVKVSFRGSGLNVAETLKKACSEIGGEAGGHEKAAGAVIPKGSESDFVASVERSIC